MPRSDCLSESELRAYVEGDLPEAALEEAADHVDRCPRCEAAARRLDPGGSTLVAALREPEAPDGGYGPAGIGDALPDGIADHEVLGKLGEGGMGVVYRARQVKLGRVVALKMLRGAGLADDEERRRFRAEAEAAARLQHPNIVQVFHVGERRTGSGPPQPYFTMEYVAGGSLADRLDNRPQPPAQAAAWLEAIARAVHHAHQAGIVHRDLKPSNVLLTADGQVKVCDFGVAKLLVGADGRTRSGVIVGTPEFMAPEQGSGATGQVGPAADVYALGAILYAALTGRPPFQGASAMETLLLAQTEEAVPPRRMQPGVPRDLETICLKCLEKEPARRYRTAEDLAEDLRRFQAGEPVRARPVGAAGRLWRWARRNPRLAGVSAALLLVVLATAVGATLAALSYRALAGSERQAAVAATRARDEAEEARRKAAGAERQARDEAETARQVSDFLGGLFEDTDPVALTGRAFGAQRRSEAQLSAREVVDRGAKRLADKLRDRPRVRAALLDKVGNVYLGLGLPEQAEPLIEEALRLRRQEFGEESADVAASMHSLGFLRFLRGDDAGAVALLRPALALRERLHGPDDPRVAETLVALALALYRQQDTAGAEAALRRAVAIRKAAFGGTSREAALALVVLGHLYLEQNEPARAAPALIEAAAALRAQEGGKDLGPLIAQMMEGQLAEATGNKAGAAKLYAALEPRAVELLGADHFLVVWGRQRLGELLIELKDFEGAERLLRESLPGKRRLMGDQHVFVAGHLYQWARCLRHLGNSAQAGDCLTEAIAIYRRHQPAQRGGLADCLGLLGALEAERGEFAAAEAIWREELDLRGRANGEKSGRLLEGLGNLGYVVYQQGNEAEALRLLREEADCRRRLHGGAGAEAGLAALDRGGEALRRGDGDSALSSFDQATTELDRLAADLPRNPLVRLDRVRAVGGACAAAALLGQSERARASWQRYQRLAGELPRDTRIDLYELARAQARGSALLRGGNYRPTAEEEAAAARAADQAVTTLGAALAAGYRDLGRLKSDPDLDPVRPRKDFDELLTRLAAGYWLVELRRFAGHTHPWVTCVAITPDGRRAISGGYDRTPRLWDLATGKELCKLEGHTKPVFGVAISDGGKRAVSSSSDGTVRLWDLESCRELRWLDADSGVDYGLALSPDGRQVLCAGEGTAGLQLWQTDGGLVRKSASGPGAILSLAFAPDGRLAVTGDSAQTVTVWDVATLEPLRRLDATRPGRRLSGQSANVWGVAVAPGGRRVLSGHGDGLVRLWDVGGQELGHWEGHGGPVRCVAFVRDDKRALSGGGGKLILWDTATGKVLARHAGGPNHLGLAVTADGRRAVTADDDGAVRLWQLPD